MTEHEVSADVLAEHLDVTKDSIYTRTARGRMPARRVGGPWKSKVTEVDEFARKGAAEEIPKLSLKEAR